MGKAIHGAAENALERMHGGVPPEDAAKKLGAIIKAQAGVLHDFKQGSIAELRSRFAAIVSEANRVDCEAERQLPREPDEGL